MNESESKSFLTQLKFHLPCLHQSAKFVLTVKQELYLAIESRMITDQPINSNMEILYEKSEQYNKHLLLPIFFFFWPRAVSNFV